MQELFIIFKKQLLADAKEKSCDAEPNSKRVESQNYHLKEAKRVSDFVEAI